MSNEGNSCNANSDTRYRVPKITRLEDIPTCEARTLEPLKRSQPCTLPIVAVRPDKSVVSEETGQVISFADYCEKLPTLARHLVVTFSSDAWLWRLDQRWHNDPRWTWSVMVQKKPRAKMRQHVTYYGFRKARKQAFTNLVIDAGSFTDDTDTDLIELGQWVRDFANTHGLRMRASAAGIANQLLRHPDFYPEARRVVPLFINATAREHLPGPFYESYVDATQRIEAATYIDQQAAYHYAAMTTPLPNSNSVRACGYTHSSGVYARAGGELFQREMRKHGLVHAEVMVYPVPPKREKFTPRLLRKPGRQRAWIWTNEIPYLEKMGMQVLHLISVWGTEEVDRNIARYAQWAASMSKQHPHLKALLLMPYGALGRRPDTIEIHAPGGDDALLLAGRWIEGTHSRSVRAQTYTANALQLGLIQAHVRALSLDMARQLSNKGEEVISVYADGIFIRLDGAQQIPMFAPWRVKEDSLQLHLSESLRVPVRAKVRRDYVAAQVAASTYSEGIA